MQQSVTYIQQSLDSKYPPEEIQSIVRWVLEYVCKITPSGQLLCKDKILSNNEKEQIGFIVDQLVHFVPLQYILGETFFYNETFIVNQSVLIPRPETEELVDLIIHENIHRPNLNILDIGTGSGCIAICLQKNLLKAQTMGVDISEMALETARLNAEKMNVSVSFKQTDILSNTALSEPSTFDIIVSNPPYIMEKEAATMEKNVMDYEPHNALFVPDEEPLLFYKQIALLGKQKLNKGGTLYFEINAACNKLMVEMLTSLNYLNVKIINDLQGKPRFAKANL